MIDNFKIINTTLSFIDKTTGELMGAIKDVTDVDLKEVNEEYVDVDFEATLPNGSAYKGIGKIRKNEFEELCKYKNIF